MEIEVNRDYMIREHNTEFADQGNGDGIQRRRKRLLVCIGESDVRLPDSQDRLSFSTINSWSVEQAVGWLSSVGLEELAPKFRDNEVDGKQLWDLTREDLQDLQIKSLGTRKRLWKLLEQLRFRADRDDYQITAKKIGRTSKTS
eukprot:TRINITY_DN17773_c0_g1_i1.p1 TRINITY_DN17773_c0_g1~~TRINITY_DN17773_c0_g1_i1.p1  ORF type:complete len:144 (-),score=18.42 TRINITY_DN17773_c0_g1_i1:144-575(-)